jgi:hypothetical protein
MNATSQVSWGILISALFFFFVFWLLSPQQFIASDQWAYSKEAYSILQDNGFQDNHIFKHRLAVTLPTAGAYGLFGVSIYSTNAVTLISALLIMMTVWAALPDRISKSVGLLLCLMSVPLIKASMTLLPDIVAAAFMGLSSVFLIGRGAVARSGILYSLVPIAAIGLLFCAFLAKLSAYWVLPLWVWAFIQDIRCSDRATLLRRFWLPVILFGLILGAGYLVICDAIWNDPLARLKSVESLAGKHLWSWSEVSALEILKRLTVSPARLFVSQYGLAVLLFAILGLILAPPTLRPWSIYLVSCIVFFWFGTSSFSTYQPLPIVGRMTLPALPGIVIFAAFAVSRVSLNLQHKLTHIWLPLLVVVAVSGQPFLKMIDSWWDTGLEETEAMAVLAKRIEEEPSADFLLISADQRSPRSLLFYFGYAYPESLMVVFAGDLNEEMLTDRTVMAFVNEQRSEFLNSVYGQRFYDEELMLVDHDIVYEKNGISLLGMKSREALVRSLSSSKSTGSPGRKSAIGLPDYP